MRNDLIKKIVEENPVVVRESFRLPVVAILGGVLVVLKATGHISLPWVWVTLPFWGGPAVLLALLAIFVVVGVFGLAAIAILEAFENRKFK
jgi:hypothetical protein